MFHTLQSVVFVLFGVADLNFWVQFIITFEVAYQLYNIKYFADPYFADEQFCNWLIAEWNTILIWHSYVITYNVKVHIPEIDSIRDRMFPGTIKWWH